MPRSLWLVAVIVCLGTLAVAVMHEPAVIDAYDPPDVRPNFLIVVADDMGVEKVGAYDPPGTKPPPTPHLDALAKEGVLFTRAYANPSCSPTRVTLLSGRDARHFGTGIALPIPGGEEGNLPQEELTFAELLRRASQRAYSVEAVGKWHVANRGDGRLRNPLLQGFQHHAGPLGNPADGGSRDGKKQDYNNWEKAVDGEVSRSNTYITLDNVAEAHRSLDRMSEPWLLYVNLTAPHNPFNIPPPSLRHRDVKPDAPMWRKYEAMVESVDIATHQIIAHLEPEVRARTWIIFVCDNGSPKEGVRPPVKPHQAKRSLYEGGIHVPLIVVGPEVQSPGRSTDVLVHTTDLLPTLMDMAGVELSATMGDKLDGRSFAYALRQPDAESRREAVYSERFEPAGPGPWKTYSRTVVGPRWKLTRYDHESREELYDLRDRMFEGNNLLAKGKSPSGPAKQARRQLAHMMDGISGPMGSPLRRSVTKGRAKR